MPSEKCAARRASVEDGRRMVTACFARALQRGTSRTYMHFLLMFQEVRLISKTRNQLIRTTRMKTRKMKTTSVSGTYGAQRMSGASGEKGRSRMKTRSASGE